MYSRTELRREGAVRTFTGRQLDMIAFPLGGIGSGCVSLGGWGQLRDWEIYGRPGKGNLNDMAFFTLYAKPAGGKAVAKVLQGPTGGPRMGPPSLHTRGGTGMFMRGHGAGLPHFRECEFSGSYPFATVSLKDRTMPLRAELEAWNPFIPLNDKDSSIPCAIFYWTIMNPTRRSFEATLFMNLSNTIGLPEVGKGLNRFRKTKLVRGLEFTTRKHPKSSPRYGTMALVTPHGDVSYLNHWYRGGWYDSMVDFWAQVEKGRLDTSVKPSVSGDGQTETGSIALHFSLKPGQSKTLPVIIAWHFPTTEKYWARPDKKGKRPTWKNYYATQWNDAWDVARYVVKDLNRFEEETRLYDETIRATTMPSQVVEAVTSTSSILKSPTCIRLTKGDFWAWEGCADDAGCCEGTCTHVWNYQQMLPYLFPSLERSIRDNDYKNNLHKDGHMTFRMPLPLGTKGNPAMHAAADGQLGGIMKVYRDWKICGNDRWLKKLWPKVKKSLEYAWVNWDRNRDGVMESVQHNTYDIEFWGPNTLCGSFYLGALRAAEEMARHVGDIESADAYGKLFKKGKAWSDKHLFNGEYFIHKINLQANKHDSWGKIGSSASCECLPGGKIRPKNQYGSGCLSDQLLGQLFAEILELGDLYSSRHIDKAAKSMFKYNWFAELFDHANRQRIYAQDEEAGLVLCTWPKGGRERFPFPYSDEAWTGIEYSTAALLAYRGLIDEALSIVKGARDRHDGTRRNPYDEFECGHHYARAMSSYAVLLALSGFVADLPNKRLAFGPRINQKDFATFFSTDSGWGLYAQRAIGGRSSHIVDVRYGSIRVKRLSLPWYGSETRKKQALVTAKLGSRAVEFEAIPTKGGVDIVLSQAVTLKPNAVLRVTLG